MHRRVFLKSTALSDTTPVLPKSFLRAAPSFRNTEFAPFIIILLCVILGTINTGVGRLSAQGLPDARVQMIHGYPQLFINGQQTPPLVLFINTMSNFIPMSQGRLQSASEIRLAAAQGVHIISFFLMPRTLPSPSHASSLSYYQTVDRLFAFILKNDPQAYLLPRVWCGVQGFDRRHPSQLIAYANGTHPQASPASNVWFHAVKRGLISLINHIKQSRYASRVIGFHLAHGNTDEWFTPDFWSRPGFDYSLPNRLGFARWLKRHYHTDTTLQRAWHDPGVFFRTVTVPPALPPNPFPFYRPAERRYVDYLNYQSDITADRIEELAAVVKKATNRRALVVTFYGYGFELPAPDNSDRALGKLLRCPNIDAIASPVSYGDRQPGGSPAFMGPVDSATLHGKLWMLEDDTNTYLDIHGQIPTPGHCANLHQTNVVHIRNFGQMMIHRLGTWWMDLCGTGWLNSPGIWSKIGQLRAIYVKYKPQNQYQPEVAVIYDERSPSYARMERMWKPLLEALLFRPIQYFHCGTSVGFYLLSDIGAPNFPKAKVIIFLNAWHVNAATREIIHKKLERGGRTLIWIYGGGFIKHGKINMAAESRLIDMTMRQRAPGFLRGSEVMVNNAIGLPVEHLAGLNTVAANISNASDLFQRNSDTPSFTVVDPAAIPLARYDGTKEVSVALKRFAGYQSMFIGEPRPSGVFWRTLFPHLGVHVYLNTNDAFQTDGRLMMISSDGVAGMRTIMMPHRSTVYNLLSGKRLATDVLDCKILLQRFQTVLLRVAGP